MLTDELWEATHEVGVEMSSCNRKKRCLVFCCQFVLCSAGIFKVGLFFERALLIGDRHNIGGADELGAASLPALSLFFLLPAALGLGTLAR